MQKYLTDKLGIENELIDYIPSGQEEFYKLFVPITNIRNLIGNILKLSIANKYKKRKECRISGKSRQNDWNLKNMN